MKTNVEALKELYIKLGGSLTDTYDDISGGAPVGEMSLISDLILAVSKKANTGGGGGGSDDVFKVEIVIEYDEEKEEPVPRLVTPFNDVFDAISGGKVVIATIETEGEGTAVSITAYGTSAYDDGEKWIYFTIFDGETGGARFVYFFDDGESGVESYVMVEDPEQFAEGGEKYFLQGSNKGAEWEQVEAFPSKVFEASFQSNNAMSFDALQLLLQTSFYEIEQAWNDGRLVFGRCNYGTHIGANAVTNQLWLTLRDIKYSEIDSVKYYCFDGVVMNGSDTYYFTVAFTDTYVSTPISILEGLPAVSAQDSGKVPTVDQYGKWGLETPAGGESEIFKIQFSQSGGTWGADKTLAEITAAYQAGKTLLARYENDDNSATLVLKVVEAGYSSFSFIGVTWYQLGMDTGYEPVIVNATIFGNDSVSINEIPINAKQTVQFSDNSGAITADKSFYDILNAHHCGQTINATYNGRIFQLVDVEETPADSRNMLHFISTDFDYPTANTVVVHKMMLDSNAGVAYSTATISAAVSSVYDGIFGPQ